MLFPIVVRTSSMSTFDSIEFGRFSDDSNKDNEDRVAGTYTYDHVLQSE